MGRVCEGEYIGCSSGDESLTLMSQLNEAFKGWKSVCKRHNREILFFLSFVSVLL